MAGMVAPVSPLALEAPSWRSPPMRIADTLWCRWKGLRPESNGMGLILRGRSVHGWGMREPLGVLALDANGVVVGRATLRPRRFLRLPGGVWMVELPSCWPLPVVGTEITLRPKLGAWPAA